MKTSFTTHGSLHHVLVLTFALVLLFAAAGNANPLEELKDIFTKDRSKLPASETDSPSQEPQQADPGPPLMNGIPTFRFPEQPKAKSTSAPVGVTDCPYRELRRVLVDDAGNISYMVYGGKRTAFTRRLAANINSPAGRAMLQMLLAPPTSKHNYIAVAGYYPAGYDCTVSNLITPAILLAVDRNGR